MNVIKYDLVLIPRIEFKWVHFDRWFYLNGEYHTHELARNVWDLRDPFTFSFPDAVAYLIDPDKKAFRSHNCFYDGEVEAAYFRSPNRFYKLRHKAWAYHNQNEIIDSIEVAKNLFICPSTGIVWQHNEDDLDCNPFQKNFGVSVHKRLWSLKRYIPNKNLKTLHFCENHYGKLGKSKTAFLSGQALEYWKTESKWGGLLHDETDYRSFLYKEHKISKPSIIKSAARYIKKISRVAPLSEATKKFFKTLGALAHIKKAATYAT